MILVQKYTIQPLHVNITIKYVCVLIWRKYIYVYAYMQEKNVKKKNL